MAHTISSIHGGAMYVRSFKHARTCLGRSPSIVLSNARPLRAAVKSRHVARSVKTTTAEISPAVTDSDREFREESRKRRRNVFGAPEWRRHRRVNRYVRHMYTMFNSNVIKGLIPPVAFFGVLAAAYISLDMLLKAVGITWSLTLPMTPFNTSASALSLLLVFRTNSSYSRWWEARMIWGGLLNRSRDFVRQGLTWFDPSKVALKAQLVRYMQAFAVALKVHLRPDEEDMRAELAPVLNEKELELAMSKVHVPNHLLKMMANIVNQASLNPVLASRMDENITAFEDSLGKCERIFKTPIPLAYTRMTSRFLIIWLALLPMALYKEMGWGAVAAEALIAFMLLGIEDIGVQVEEPFSIISCEGICTSIVTNTNAMLETDASDKELIQLDGCAPIHGAPVLSVDSAAPNPKLHTARNGTMEHGEQLAMMQAKIDQLEAHTAASESKPQPAAHIQAQALSPQETKEMSDFEKTIFAIRDSLSPKR
mmetsp:Transcript_22851/g.43678  ORF Transcript_22851/g.43678 Transcript_22851/m.43678 type:complete len:482 (+) Transcript_22851:112-1557(+)